MESTSITIKKLYRHVAGIDVSCYDSPEFYNQFILAARNSDTTALKSIAALNNALVTMAQILISGGLILSNLRSIFWIVLPASILYAVISSKNAKLRVEMTAAQNPMEKRREYVKRMFFTKRQALDIRMTDTPKLLMNMLDSCEAESISTIKPFVKKRVLCYVINGVLFYGQYVATIVLLSWHALGMRDISVGDFSMLLSSAITLCNGLRFIGNSVSDLAEQGAFAGKYYQFLEFAENPKAGQPTVLPEPFKTLSAEHVAFRYQKESAPVFHDVSIDIRAGQKIAIVGSNGVGKSTLVQLILNLYSPQKGTIWHNAKDIRVFDKNAYRAGYAQIFQDNLLYPFSISENLLLRSMEGEADESRLWSVLRQVGLEKKIRQLPLGLMTPVTKEFDNKGVVFSDGEAQRLAFARALLQDAPFFIMDEPTSALDPKQELQINALFTSTLHDKTLVLISHRLSTISGVDFIYRIENGAVEEAGTHDALMAMNGHYARIYRAQAALYAMEELKYEST